MASLKTVCFIFCWPPWPSKIVAKLAFAPPEPTYHLHSCDNSIYTLIPETAALRREPLPILDESKVKCYLTRTKRNNLITCIYFRCCKESRFTLLYSHGNAVDLGQLCYFYLELGTRIYCNIFGYDYSGYGVSTGKPSEKNLYADIEAAFDVLCHKVGVEPRNIILYGQSIGTVPSVDLASKCQVAGVILQSPLMSGLRVIRPQTKRTWCCDAFVLINKVKNVESPVLVIHGTNDKIVDISHGVFIFEHCRNPARPLFLVGAGHNDIEEYQIFLERLKTFIHAELEEGTCTCQC